MKNLKIFKLDMYIVNMKKELVIGVLFCLFIILCLNLVLAEDNESSSDDVVVDTSSGIDKAYSCLGDEIESKSSLSLDEGIFGMLALGNKQKLRDAIEDNEKSGQDCWPKSGCTIKKTAQVLLAYDRIGQSTEDIQDWLEDKIGTASDLTWYLEIDIQNHVPAECEIRYGSVERTINVEDDLTLSGNGGSCLSISNSGYWLKINNECLDEEFEVSCDEDFITTLLYRKGLSGTLFVSSETHSASSLGTTSEKVNSECFKSGNVCDYEGSLWASLALNKMGEDVDSYLPYLSALASDNKKYFPSSFLYILTGGQEHFTEIVQNQKQEKYWEIIGSAENRFYDTSLAMLSLSGSGATELGNAQNYLLDIQTKDGCWNNNNIRDTAFVLYSGWGKSVSGSGGGIDASCAGAGRYCEAQFDCLESGGTVLGEYECSGFREVCCSIDVREQTCAEKGGIVCSAGKECDGSSTTSIDGSCCLGTCIAPNIQNTCELFEGNCRSSCSDDEKKNDNPCSDSSEVCCVTKEVPDESNRWPWIIVLGILILLVLIGIIYRNKIRMWWFRRKGRASVSPARPRGPPGAGVMGMGRPIQRFGAPIRRAVSSGTREMEETMRKLQELGK